MRQSAVSGRQAGVPGRDQNRAAGQGRQARGPDAAARATPQLSNGHSHGDAYSGSMHTDPPSPPTGAAARNAVSAVSLSRLTAQTALHRSLREPVERGSA